jgi:uncharacterized protein YhbP (UPF0306 family)
MNAQELVQTYLADSEIMQLATVADGQPWICTVHFAADQDMNLYWMSLRNRRHSQEVAAYANAAVTVVKSEEDRQAIQMAGKAFELVGEEAKVADQVYAARFGSKPERLEEALHGGFEDRAYYVFRPDEVVLFDVKNFPDEPRQTVK